MKDELRQSDFYKSQFKPNLLKCLKLLGDRQIEHIICYGLGSFTNGFGIIASRYQLVLILLIHEELIEHGCPLSDEIEIYDPLFKDEDVDILTSYTCPKFRMIEQNEHCARKISTSSDNGCVLVFMPHMDNEFYNNLLGANWHADSLRKLVILGNDFNSFCDDPLLAHQSQARFPYVSQLVNNLSEFRKKKRKRLAKDSETNEVPIKRALVQLLLTDEKDTTDIDFDGSFSDMAFHLLDSSWLKENGRRIEQSRIKDWKCEVIRRYDAFATR